MVRTQDAQTRTYTHDALSRLTSVKTPETKVNGVQGAVTNAYDNFDNLITRTDARNVVSNYSYDALNRLIGVAYTVPNGSGVSAMPNNCTLPGGTSPNANVCLSYTGCGLVSITDGVGSENYTYSNGCLVSQLQKVINGTTYTMLYA